MVLCWSYSKNVWVVDNLLPDHVGLPESLLLPIIIIFLLFGIRDVWLNSDLWIRLVNNAELLQGDRVPAEIEKKEEKGNEAAIIDDINEDEENIGAVKTKEDEAVNWKPKSR